jgi:hypothetical protein
LKRCCHPAAPPDCYQDFAYDRDPKRRRAGQMAGPPLLFVCGGRRVSPAPD